MYSLLLYTFNSAQVIILVLMASLCIWTGTT